MKKTLATLLLLTAAMPLAAQDLGQKPPADTPVETTEEEGLSGSVSFEGNLEDLGIAIPRFATDRDAPTPANSGGTAALGRELAQVVYNDLKNNGLFKPVGPSALPQPTFGEITSPAWPTWRTSPRNSPACTAGVCASPPNT